MTGHDHATDGFRAPTREEPTIVDLYPTAPQPITAGTGGPMQGGAQRQGAQRQGAQRQAGQPGVAAQGGTATGTWAGPGDTVGPGAG